MAKKYLDKFWFEPILFSRGITLKQGRAGMYVTNLTDIVLQTDYGEDFAANKKDDAAGNAIFPIYSPGKLEESGRMLAGLRPGVKQALNLMASGGHSANTLLGKEWDIQTTARILESASDTGKDNSKVYKNEERWAELAKVDGHTKISEFVDMLTAEWLVASAGDTEMDSKLLAAGEAEFVPLAKPVINTNGMPLYPPFMVKTKDGEKKTVDIVAYDAVFKRAVEKMQKVLGVSIVLDKAMDASQVKVKTKGRIKKLSEWFANGYRRHGNKMLRSVRNISEIHYGRDLRETDNATQLYAILKEVSYHAMVPYQDDISRVLRSGEGFGMPDPDEIKKSDLNKLTAATAAYIASEIVYIFVEKNEVAQGLHNVFRQEVANTLSSFSADNEWAVSLMSGIVDISVNFMAYNAHFTPDDYAQATGLPSLKNYRTMDEVMFAKKKYPRLTATQVAEREEAMKKTKAKEERDPFLVNIAEQPQEKEEIKPCSVGAAEKVENKKDPEFVGLSRFLLIKAAAEAKAKEAEDARKGVIEFKTRAIPWDEYSKNFTERISNREPDCMKIWDKSCNRIESLIQREHKSLSTKYVRELSILKELENAEQSESRLKKQGEKVCGIKRSLDTVSKIIPKFVDLAKSKDIQKALDESKQMPEYKAARELIKDSLELASFIVVEAGSDMGTYEYKSVDETFSGIFKRYGTRDLNEIFIKEKIRPVSEEAEKEIANQPRPC